MNFYMPLLKIVAILLGWRTVKYLGWIGMKNHVFRVFIIMEKGIIIIIIEKSCCLRQGLSSCFFIFPIQIGASQCGSRPILSDRNGSPIYVTTEIYTHHLIGRRSMDLLSPTSSGEQNAKLVSRLRPRISRRRSWRKSQETECGLHSRGSATEN